MNGSGSKRGWVGCLTRGLVGVSAAACVLGTFDGWAAGPAGLRLPTLFSDGMVLQREAPVRVWGWADPGEVVTVDFAGQHQTAKTGTGGMWEVKLAPLPASAEPRDLTVKGPGDQVRVCHRVVVGEIWVCSGQSNMDYPLENVARGTDVFSVRNMQEMTTANDPLLRQFAVKNAVSADGPATDCQGAWAACEPGATREFSAVGYYFGRALRRELGVPVGLVKSAWGGTPIEPWTRVEVLVKEPPTRDIVEMWRGKQHDFEKSGALGTYEASVAEWKQQVAAAKAADKPAPAEPRKPEQPKDHNFWPGTLYNAKIAPLTPFAIRGVIWYQGEGNAANKYGLADLYSVTFPRMIEDWRSQWGQVFPFLWVQLTDCGTADAVPGDNYWSVLRDAQRLTLAVTNTGMAVTLDIGDPGNIHAPDKLDVGERLALWALARTYGKPIQEWSGPLYRESRRDGAKLLVTFDHAGSGLMVGKKNGFEPAQEVQQDLACFQIAGPERKWVWAKAKIAGRDTVAVWSDGVAEPVAVRYAWSAVPVGANLYNKEGLPASVFRTDDWPALPKEK